MKYIQEGKQINTKIVVGSAVIEKVIELEEITREGRIRMTSKEVMSFVMDMVGKQKFLINFLNMVRRERWVIFRLKMYVLKRRLDTR